jgi:hypothetical protein
MSVRDQGRQVGVPIIEATKNIENKGAVQNWFTQGSQGVGRMLHLVAIICDREIPLNKGLKLSVEEDGMSFFIANKLFFETKAK